PEDERAVTERVRKGLAQRAGLLDLAQLADKAGDGRLNPPAQPETAGPPHHDPADHDLVGPEQAWVARGAGADEAGYPGDKEDDCEGRARREGRHPRATLRPPCPQEPLTSADEPGDGQRDGRPGSHTDA